MPSRVISKVQEFRWQQWLVLALFLLVAGFTSFRAINAIREMRYWQTHRDDPIRGWMSVGYVAHSYKVPPHILYLALGLPHKPPDARPLRDIAKAQHRSMDDIRAILQDAIIHARPPYPPPPPPPPDPGRSP